MKTVPDHEIAAEAYLESAESAAEELKYYLKEEWEDMEDLDHVVMLAEKRASLSGMAELHLKFAEYKRKYA